MVVALESAGNHSPAGAFAFGFRGGGQAFRDFGPAQAARRWQQRRSSCRTGGGRKRELVADSIGAAMEAHEGEVAAEQMDTGGGRAPGGG